MPTLFHRQHNEKKEKRIAPLVSDPPHASVRTIMTPLTSFAVSPEGVRFETQEKEEQVILFLRQHLIVMLPSLLLVLLLLVAPILLFPLFFQIVPLPFSIPSQYLVVGVALWYVVTFGVALTSFLRWFFNIYILTNIRIIDVDFIHLVYKEFSEARLDKIQDLSYKSGGVMASFFDYGNVYVETAGGTPNIEFDAVPNPAKVVETISSLLGTNKGVPI